MSAPFRHALSERGLHWAVGIPRHQKVYAADVSLIFPVARSGRPRKRHIPDSKSTLMPLAEALDDPNLFAPHFRAPSWRPWGAFLPALWGSALYEACTGRKTAPARAVNEAALIVGRRGGKSRILALIAVFLACFRYCSAYFSLTTPSESGDEWVCRHAVRNDAEQNGAGGGRCHRASARQAGVENDHGEDDAGQAAWPEPANEQLRGDGHACSREREEYRQDADHGQAEHGIDHHSPSHLG